MENDIIDARIKTANEIIKAHPLLTRDEEVKLVNIINKYKVGIRYQQARDKLFNSNIRLVFKEAGKFASYLNACNRSFEVEDLVSAGYEGLNIAIDKFDTSYNTKFSTYAISWIRQKIQYFTTENLPTVRVPVSILNHKKEYLKIKDKNYSEKEIKKRLKLSEKQLKGVLTNVSVFSLNQKICSKIGETEIEWQEQLEDTKSENPLEAFINKDLKNVLLKAMESLEPLHKDILYKRYFDEDQDILKNIGKIYGVSAERIRQIEKDALKKLKQKLQGKISKKDYIV